MLNVIVCLCFIISPMKKQFFFATIFASVVAFTACTEKSTDAESTDLEATEASVATPDEGVVAIDAAPTNEPKTYTVNLASDSAFLGKEKEAFFKITKAEAIELQDQDGNSQGTELRLSMNLTNRNPIGGNAIGVSSSDFRLQLEDGTKITSTSGSYWGAQPESTQEAEPVVFTIPAGAKPKTLNLFYDNTRVSVGVSLK